MLRRHITLATAALAALLCAACFEMQREFPEKRHFVLQIDRDGKATHNAGDKAFPGVLKIRRFRVSPRYSGRSLVYRKTDVVFETDFYNEFLTAPGANLTEEVRRWLVESRLFARVADSTSRAEACYYLEAQVNSLYGDLRNTASPRSTVEIQFFVLKTDDVVLFDRTYTETVSAGGGDPEALIVAMNTAVQNVLAKLESDLAGSELGACEDGFAEGAVAGDDAGGDDDSETSGD